MILASRGTAGSGGRLRDVGCEDRAGLDEADDASFASRFRRELIIVWLWREVFFSCGEAVTGLRQVERPGNPAQNEVSADWDVAR